MAGSNKQPFGSRPGPKPVNTHGPHGPGVSAPQGGKGGEQKKSSTPGRTGANPRKLH